jgi:hypothetical protein
MQKNTPKYTGEVWMEAQKIFKYDCKGSLLLIHYTFKKKLSVF